MSNSPVRPEGSRTPARKILRLTGITIACVLVLILAIAAWYVIRFYPRKIETREINTPDLSYRVLIATQGSDFKNGLVSVLCDRLGRRPAYVKVIDVGGLDEVETDRWQKILVLNTAMMNKLSRPVGRLISRAEGSHNILLLITSGGADYKPADLEIDAISGASRQGDINRLSGLIMTWLENDAGHVWEPDDHVLALEYFLQVDVDTACAAIRADEKRYRALYPNLENRLNGIGYDFTGRGRLDKALTAFRLNRDLFPESWNVYDSYAEALRSNGDRDASIAAYRKSLELNPESENGMKALKELEAKK